MFTDFFADWDSMTHEITNIVVDPATSKVSTEQIVDLNRNGTTKMHNCNFFRRERGGKFSRVINLDGRHEPADLRRSPVGEIATTLAGGSHTDQEAEHGSDQRRQRRGHRADLVHLGRRELGRRLLRLRRQRRRPLRVVYFAVPPGKRLGWHTDTAEETQFILSGSGELLLDEGSQPVRAGDVVILTIGTGHDLRNTAPRICAWSASSPSPQVEQHWTTEV